MTRVLCLFLALLALAAPARADEAQDLIAKYFAWRGGAAYEQLTTTRTDADLKAGGLNGTTREWRERAGRTRDEYDLGPIKGSAATAAASWRESEGVVEDMPASAVRDTRRALALDFGDALRGHDGAAVKLLGNETRDGRSWSVVRVTFGDADTFDAFLDPATGALHGWRIVQDKRERFLLLDDWRMVDGVRMPFLRKETTDNEAGTQVVTARKVELNQAFGPSIFARPAERRIASFDGGAKGTGPIKFDFFNGTRIYIPATVNGHPVKVLLDSGADFSVIDKGFADEIGVKYSGRGVASGAGGETDAYYAEAVQMQIGNMRLDNRNVGVIDMSDVSRRLNIPLPFVLGEDVFNQLIVDIDFDKAEIAFHDPATFTPPPGAIVVPVSEGEGIRSVAVSVEGHEPIQVDFDLGNGGNFSVGPSFWQKHGLLDGRPQSKTMGGAVGGAREEIVAVLKTLTFAGIDFENVPTTFTTPGVGRNAVDSERQPGNIGLPVLSRFRLITDYPNDRLYLVPHKDVRTKPFRKDRSGLQTVMEGGQLKVFFVAPGSPALVGGWKAGEVVTAIDGHPITADYNGSELSRWRYGAAGENVTLTLADGSKRTLTLKDYF